MTQLQLNQTARHKHGRIKLFGAPMQWKYFRPLFQAVFLSGGGITPQTESNTEITNILFCILNLWRRTYCSGFRGCDTRVQYLWKYGFEKSFGNLYAPCKLKFLDVIVFIFVSFSSASIGSRVVAIGLVSTSFHIIDMYIEFGPLL